MIAQTATNITYERTYLAARNIDIEILNTEVEVNTNDIIDIPWMLTSPSHPSVPMKYKKITQDHYKMERTRHKQIN